MAEETAESPPCPKLSYRSGIDDAEADNPRLAMMKRIAWRITGIGSFCMMLFCVAIAIVLLALQASSGGEHYSGGASCAVGAFLVLGLMCLLLFMISIDAAREKP